MISFFVRTLSLSEEIASIASFPLVLIPVAIYVVAFRSWGTDMRPIYKRLLIAMFVLGICAYAVDIADRFGWLLRLQNYLPLIERSDCVIRNDRITLDGFSYKHCTFEHVTLVYNGGPAVFSFNTMIAPIVITSDNPRILTTISMLNGLNMLKNVRVEDQNGKTIQPGTQIKETPQ